jgi:N-acyl homoserine lactone hydrolase
VEMKLFALTCGWLSGDLGLFFAGESGKIRIPVPAFLIDHPKGKVLFDSGMHPDAGRDPAGRLLPVIAKLFGVELAEGEDVASRLAAIGVDPAAIDLLVTSHLHFDHTGGHATIPNARLVVQRAEWQAGHDADLSARNGFDPRDYDCGHEVLELSGEHDLFGDGRVVCLPTPGHTPGHQSLRVRLDGGGEVVLTADACYMRRTLETMHLPAVVHDPDLMRASLERLRALERAGARIVYGHDPDLWKTIPQAPAEIR